MLGVEHTTSLGDTIQKIAWHKAGIMKVLTYLCTFIQYIQAFLLNDKSGVGIIVDYSRDYNVVNGV